MPNLPLKPGCTPDKLKRVKRWKHEGVLDKMQARLDRMSDAMGVRRQTVENAFGTMKAWMGSTHFLTKRIKKVRTEISLHVLAYNIMRNDSDVRGWITAKVDPGPMSSPLPRSLPLRGSPFDTTVVA